MQALAIKRKKPLREEPKQRPRSHGFRVSGRSMALGVPGVFRAVVMFCVNKALAGCAEADFMVPAPEKVHHQTACV